jgi:hypothetical protein
MDVEWKRLLRKRLAVHGEAHENAKAFWTVMCYLRQNSNLDERGQETLEDCLRQSCTRENVPYESLLYWLGPPLIVIPITAKFNHIDPTGS